MATARTQVAVQECSRTVGFLADRIDVAVEAQFGVDGDAKIRYTILEKCTVSSTALSASFIKRVQNTKKYYRHDVGLPQQ